MVKICQCEICNETIELENKKINEPYRCNAHKYTVVIGEEVEI